MAWTVGESIVWRAAGGTPVLRVSTIQRVTPSGRGIDENGSTWLPDGREYGGDRLAHAITSEYAEQLEVQARKQRLLAFARELERFAHSPDRAVTAEVDEAVARLRDVIRRAFNTTRGAGEEYGLGYMQGRGAHGPGAGGGK